MSWTCDTSGGMPAFIAGLVARMADLSGPIGMFLLFALFLCAMFYLLSRFFSSDRKMYLLFQDTFRNTLISVILLIALPGFLYIFCVSANAIVTNSLVGGSNFLSIADKNMANLENQLISKIRNYRELAINTYASEASKSMTIPNILFGGAATVPYIDAPKNEIYLDRANTGIGSMNYLLISIALQRFIIGLVTSTNIFFEVLALSLLIRIFPFFREAGDFIFALTISFALMLPLLYVLFTSPFVNSDFSQQICDDINSSDSMFKGNSFQFLNPLTCYDVALLGTLNVYAIFLPNVIYGLLFLFASNFKKIFDLFEWGS